MNPAKRLAWEYTFASLQSRAYWRRWDNFSLMTEDERRHIISDKLLATIRYFGARSDAMQDWTRFAQCVDLASVMELWQELPILQKADLQTLFDPQQIKERFNIDGNINATGGSTGQPTRFIFDKAAQREKSSSAYYCWQKFGWFPGMPYIAVWGSQRDIGRSDSKKSRFIRTLRSGKIISAYNFNDEVVDQVVSAIADHPNVALYGYTSLLEALANRLLERNIGIAQGSVAVAWNGGEPLSQDQSKRFQSVFGVGINDLYGSREFGALAYQCLGESQYKLLRPSFYLEIVGDDGRPVHAGQAGRILVTSLTSRGTPFIRYDFGDMAVWEGDQKDHSGINAISQLVGRTSGIIRLRSGKSLHNIFWNQLFKEFPSISHFHVHQEITGDLDVSLWGERLPESSHQRLTDLISAIIGDRSFAIRYRTDEVARTTEGKLVQVTSEFPGSFE